MIDIYPLLWICLTLLFIGFFAGYEIAFISANRLSIELKKKQGKASAIILSRFMQEPAKFISSCLIGFNIFLVLYGLTFSQIMGNAFWEPLYRHLHLQNNYARLVIDTILSTVIVLIFGEFFPKALFRAKSNSWLTVFARFAAFFHYIFEPFTNFFVGISQWILKYIFNINVRNRNEPFTHVDLEHFYQQSKDDPEDNPELNKEMFENALSLPMVKIRSCLVPRTEIEAVEIDATVEELMAKFTTTRLSRLLVYKDNLDNILGYVHQLGLFKKPNSIEEILIQIPAIPETMSATDLISQFSRERKSIAWVVDEFGGTAGIVTMEDVLEEIFGEIRDEYDVEELEERQISETEFQFSGRMELDYLNEKYDLHFPESESETLSGYIINEYETIPKPKEFIVINKYQFEIIQVSDTRIEMVKMKILR